MTDIIFSWDSSLIDQRNMVPNFNCPSQVLLEREVDGSVQLYPVQAFVPAFDSETSAFLIQPQGLNAITWNLTFNKQDTWIAGSNVIIYPDEITAPDGSSDGDRISFSPGTGSTQSIKRSFSLEPAQDYTFSGLIALAGGQCDGQTDLIRFNTGVVGTPQIRLSVLNDFPGKTRLLEITFKTLGRLPDYPDNPHQVGTYTITSVTATSITISMASAVAAGAFVGGEATFSNIANTGYTILSNTATSGGSVTIVLQAANLNSDGVVAGTSRLTLSPARRQSVELEIRCHNSVALDMGGLQLEALPFRTSMIYQRGALVMRSLTRCEQRISPIRLRRTFGAFIELKYWRGDGNLCDFGNFSLSINQGRVTATAGSVVAAASDPLPTQNVKIFAQVSEANSTISLYVNGILKARSSISGFQADPQASLSYTTEGVRSIQRFLCFGELVLDGQPPVGGQVTGELADIFQNPTLIDATAVSAHAPLLKLNTVAVPAKELYSARTKIIGITAASRIVTVESNANLVIGQGVTILRETAGIRAEDVVLKALIRTITGTNIELDTVDGLLINDILYAGNLFTPGKTSVRFYYEPIDAQVIQSIDPTAKRLRMVGSVTAFIPNSRAFVTTPEFQDVAEITINTIDPANRDLYVDNVIGLVPGQVISQPLNELIIDPQNYSALLLNQAVPGLTISGRHTNAVEISNSTYSDQLAEVAIRPFL